MLPNNQSMPWEFDPYDPFFPISYEGVGVGFCTLDFADRIVEILNEDGKLRKALKMACADLIKQSGGDPNRVNELMQKYLEKSERPKYGTGAIAYLLRDRQEELDMSDKEFTRFCDSYKLSPEELKEIYQGKAISDRQIGLLARILRKSIEELTKIRNGSPKSELDLETWKMQEGRIHSQNGKPKTKLLRIHPTPPSKGKIAGANSD
jgi:hypothetical protein